MEKKTSINLIKIKTPDCVTLDAIHYKSNSSKSILISTHGMISNCLKERDKVIEKKLEELNIDYIKYNNRGTEVAKYISRDFDDGTEERFLGGTAFEDPLDSYYDILGIIEFAVNSGYQNIYLQGHSLGSTKTLYTYLRMKKENNKYLKFIKGIILLSLVDIPSLFTYNLKENGKYDEYLNLALKKETENDLEYLLPEDAALSKISVKTFLRYLKYNEEINFARYSDSEFDYREINSIDIPLFMRWGNNRELVLQPLDDLVNMLNEKIKNINKDINYIDGADHSFHGKEEILAQEIYDFIKKNRGEENG